MISRKFYFVPSPSYIKLLQIISYQHSHVPLSYLQLFSALKLPLEVSFSASLIQNLTVMDLSWIELLLLTILILGIYKYLTKNDGVFEKRGVPYLKPTILLGNLGALVTGRENGFEFFQSKYDKFKNDK